MVKAGKHTLALASRYSPLAASSVRRIDTRRPMTSEVYIKSEGATTPGSPPALKMIRAEFCKKYKSKLEENAREPKAEESEVKELRTLYRKLRGVIPSLSEGQIQPVTSLDVVLGAIDYIRDLHKMLDGKFPSHADLPNVTSTPISANTSTCIAGRTPLSQLENRRPEFVSQMESSSSDEDSPSL